MTDILDSYALLVFLEKESNYKKLEVLFTKAIINNTFLLMSSINYGEVLYIILRECGLEKMQEIKHIIDTLPIKVVDVDKDLAELAGKFKAFKKMSYADCFVAALAKQKKGRIITGDMEFKEVKDEIKVFWI